MRLESKVVLVTGGTRGIGFQIAQTFAKEGATVAFCGTNEAKIKEVEAQLQASGAKALGVKTDVSDAKSVDDLVGKVLDKFGRVDILVNNAGITRDTLLLRMKESDWEDVLAVNLKGAFLCAKAVARGMIKQRAGRIINVSSVIGLVGNAGQANYAASKAGLIGLTKSLSKELGSRGITVNALAPGFIETDMTGKLPQELRDKWLGEIPLGSFGQPADVAEAAVFLASEAARYITGQVLQVDGGLST